MKILIVSGFLGSGKTTFIKELIRRSGTRPVIMENEYGENNLDAQELAQDLPEQKEMKILEFMEGCVCCTMKDRFVNSVLTVFSALDPEYLVVEPTGVGRLSSILENLRPILHDKICILQPIVVLAPRTYSSNMAEWPQLYSDQVANAGIVVFSKGEREDPGFLEDTAARIRAINPHAEIVSEHYSLRPDAWWRDLMDLPAEVFTATREYPEGESFSQLSFQTAGLHQPSELVVLLEDCLRGEFGHIIWAKGVLPAGARCCASIWRTGNMPSPVLRMGKPNAFSSERSLTAKHCADVWVLSRKLREWDCSHLLFPLSERGPCSRKRYGIR